MFQCDHRLHKGIRLVKPVNCFALITRGCHCDNYCWNSYILEEFHL
jgi:hypothetical protein